MIETPANPTLDLVDISGVVRQAGGTNGVPVSVDSTFATPVLQRPAEHGAAYVIHSSTKFLGGHGDVLAGAVACSEMRAAGLRRVRILTGGVLHPWAAYLLHRGLPTLGVRVRQAQATATDLARRLDEHDKVIEVYHPSIPGRDPQRLVGRQMSGAGAMLSFKVEGGFAAADAVLRAVRLITPAVSLGSTESLMQHPAGLTQRASSAEARHRGPASPRGCCASPSVWKTSRTCGPTCGAPLRCLVENWVEKTSSRRHEEPDRRA